MDISQRLYRWWRQRGVPIPCADEACEFPRLYKIYGSLTNHHLSAVYLRLPEAVRFLRSYCGKGTVQLTFFELKGFTIEVASDGWVVITPYTNESTQSLKLFNTGFALPAPRIWTYRTEDGEYSGRVQILWEPSTGSLCAKGWTYGEEQPEEVAVPILEPAAAKPQPTVSRLLQRRTR